MISFFLIGLSLPLFGLRTIILPSDDDEALLLLKERELLSTLKDGVSVS
jgi:hypothetical protein